jgi:glycosyltransferase involved in cell wall biosynthesis
MSNQRKRILVIGMVNSVHLAGWISQFVDQPIDFVIFPSTQARQAHPIIEKLINSKTNRMSVSLQPKFMLRHAFVLTVLDIPFKNRFRSHILKKLITEHSFDLIHVLELQHAGYLLLGTKLAPNLPKVFVTNWGSDIYWFEQFPKHKAKIIQLLQIASYYSAECQRDIEIVERLGYNGATMPVIPNRGGINLDEIPKSSLPPSQRKKIMIKGYTGFVGQALIAIKACELAAEHLRGYEIVIYSASIKSRIRSLKLRFLHKVNVKILEKQTSHVEMLQHFSEARIYMGISLSDGISTSLLEAMATGCYPIQTRTSCASEWITHRVSGSIINNIDAQEVSLALVNAVTQDQFVDKAAELNSAVAVSRIGKTAIIPIAGRFYAQIFDAHDK